MDASDVRFGGMEWRLGAVEARTERHEAEPGARLIRQMVGAEVVTALTIASAASTIIRDLPPRRP